MWFSLETSSHARGKRLRSAACRPMACRGYMVPRGNGTAICGEPACYVLPDGTNRRLMFRITTNSPDRKKARWMVVDGDEQASTEDEPETNGSQRQRGGGQLGQLCRIPFGKHGQIYDLD